jgi:N-acetylglucosamine kinase-like BadF-type ATPase
MKLFLGVDGGQSSTTALAGDEQGRIVGIGRAGPCNHAGTAEGREKFLTALGESVRAASDAAQVDAQFECACLGLSGGPSDKDALAREIVRAEKYIITHDAAVALSGALAGAPGIIVIAGTGSIAFGRNLEGRTARAGGWGYIFGDDASAFGLVRRALCAVLRNEEGWGARTRLREALLEATGAHDAHDLLHRFYSDQYPRARIASLAKAVDETAILGDAVAREILSSGAQALMVLVSAVRAQLFPYAESPRLSYSGGVFRSRILFEQFKTLAELDCNLTAPQYGPAAGALLEAYRACGIRADLTGVPEEKI